MFLLAKYSDLPGLMLLYPHIRSCQAVADGGAIYKLESNAEQGIHKGDPIKSFDDLNGFQWVYEYKGALVNCSASKYGGSKSADRFELRFGR